MKDFFEGVARAFESLFSGIIVPMASTDSEPVVVTVVPPVEPQNAPTSELNLIPMIDTFCTAIRDFEGGPGDLNYQNNNPGNCRCSPDGYLPKYGTVECVETASGRFAKFETYALGWAYLEALVMEWAAAHPQWSILDFFETYSPPSDNNPTSTYAIFVAKRCGVPVSTTLSTLFTTNA